MKPGDKKGDGRTARAEALDLAALQHALTLLQEHPRHVTIPALAQLCGQSLARLYARFGSNSRLFERLIDHQILCALQECARSAVQPLATDNLHLARAWAIRCAHKDQRRALVAAISSRHGVSHIVVWACIGALEWACDERPDQATLRNELIRFFADLGANFKNHKR